MKANFPAIFRQILLLLLLALPLAVLSAFFHPRPPVWEEDVLGPGEVRLETVLDWESVLWIDARTVEEFEEEHVPDALLLNEEEWDDRLFDVFEGYMQDPAQKIVVYCGGSRCERSTQVAQRLREDIDDAEIWVLKGGWDEWKQFAK